MEARLLAAPLPGRDPLDLAVRLRGVSRDTPLSAPSVAAPLEAGRVDTFAVLDQGSAQLFEVAAELRLVSEHAYWYVQTDLRERAPQPALERSADVFERTTYPTIHRYFGSEPIPGVDGDPRVVFLLANVPGVAAYFSSVDAYPKAVNPRSNEREMVYVNLNAIRPGQSSFDSTIAHEMQHMAHFGRCPTQESWVDEGAAELASRLAGFDGGPPQAFMSRPDIQLNTWGSLSADLPRHYQAAYLFLRYVAERGGGWDTLPRLLETCLRGEALFERLLQTQPLASDFPSLVADWAVANLVNDPAIDDGLFTYANGTVKVSSTGTAARDVPFAGSVPQFAADYIELPRGSGTAAFSGETIVPLLPVADSDLWWSNRADSLDSRLTRRLDLRDVTSATLQMDVWYDVEDQFDYVYVSASRDGGLTWQVLPGRHTEHDRSVGNSYGLGWTGRSGGGRVATWVEEEVDLTPFAGSDALLRFEYVTDQGFNGQGFAFRNLRVPQLALFEPAAAEAGWLADGWVRVDAPVPQRWELRVIRWLTDGSVRVEAVPVAANGSATFPLVDDAERSVLVVAPSAPRTLQPASYSLSLTP
jgi:immune inhibitor A